MGFSLVQDSRLERPPRERTPLRAREVSELGPKLKYPRMMWVRGSPGELNLCDLFVDGEFIPSVCMSVHVCVYILNLDAPLLGFLFAKEL